MDYIELNFQQAKQQAAKLESLAIKLENLAKKDLNGTLQQLSEAWKGESASAYMQKGQRLEEKIVQTAKELKKTAQTIRSTAKRTYNAEMRARELARQREYGG